MTQGKHTPGPLWFHPEEDDARGTDCGGFYAGVDGDFAKSKTVCWFGDSETYYNTCGDAPEINDARRICAAWNACEGITTEALEDGAVRDMMEASPRAVLMMRIASELIRDGLAVEQTVFYDDAECDGYCVADDLDYAAEALDAAIARATGEKP